MYYATDIVDALDSLTQSHTPFRSASLSVKVKHGVYCATVRVVRRVKPAESNAKTLSFTTYGKEALQAVRCSFDSAAEYLRTELSADSSNG